MLTAYNVTVKQLKDELAKYNDDVELQIVTFHDESAMLVIADTNEEVWAA